MKPTAFIVILLAALSNAYSPIGTPKKAASLFDLKNAALGAFVAASLASGIATTPASAIDSQFGSFGSTTFVAEKVVREGIYREYEVELPDEQQLDDAQSTFKSAKETKSKKGKYTALLAILVVGSFVIPMAQYFWYVRDDDSTERFFNEPPSSAPTKRGGAAMKRGGKKQPTPAPEPPKKKGWF